MKVFEIMSIDVGFVRLDEDLSKAAAIMWEKDCGVVPIVTDELVVVGIVTDRDIAIASASRNRPPSAIRACEMIADPPIVCGMEDSVADVLKTMSRLGIRRLPVAGERRELFGMISIADILSKGRKKDFKRALKTLIKLAGRGCGAECIEI